MAGTILVASCEMRVMPPSITTATGMTMRMPISARSCQVFSRCSSGSVITVISDSVSWLACITHKQPIMAKMQKKRAIGRSLGLMPSVSTYIGPPCTLPRLSLPLYIIANVPSKNLVAIPNRALTHIQKMAPGPPIAMAMATPAMLPIPTVLLMALISA